MMLTLKAFALDLLKLVVLFLALTPWKHI